MAVTTRFDWKTFAPSLFSVVVILFLAANYFSPFGDLDYTWQVRTGERILQTRQLLTTEDFTYTITGQQLPDFEWLYEVILATVWAALGYGGLKLLRVLLVAATLLLLGLRLRREGVGWHGIAVSIFVAVAVLAPAWNLRPLFCTTLGLLLVSGWLHDHCNGRRPLSWWLPVVMLLWGNLHPGVITGQGLLAGAIAWEWLNRWLKWNPPLDVAACRRLTLIGGLGLAATFISPEPLQRLLFPFRPEVRAPVQLIWTEMQPLYTFTVQPPFTVNLAYLVAGLVAVTVVLRFRHYRLWELALLLGLAGLANLAFRSLQDWMLVMLAVGVPHIAVLWRELVLQRRRLAPAERRVGLLAPVWRTVMRAERSCKRVLATPWLRFDWRWPALAVGVLVVLSLVPSLARQMPVQDAREWPAAALDWMEAEGIRGNVFSPPDYGAYVTWRLRDRAHSYADTRGFFFPAAVLEDSHYLPQLGPDWRDRMDRVLDHGTDYFLLETTGARARLWLALQPHVERPLYLDGQAVLLSRAQVEQALAHLAEPEALARETAAHD